MCFAASRWPFRCNCQSPFSPQRFGLPPVFVVPREQVEFGVVAEHAERRDDVLTEILVLVVAPDEHEIRVEIIKDFPQRAEIAAEPLAAPRCGAEAAVVAEFGQQLGGPVRRVLARRIDIGGAEHPVEDVRQPLVGQAQGRPMGAAKTENFRHLRSSLCFRAIRSHANGIIDDRHGTPPSPLIAAGKQRRFDGSRGPVGMTRIERRRRVVFDAELDCPGGCLAGDFGDDAEPKIDAGADAAGSDHVAVLDDPGLLVRRPDQRQQIGKSPMRRCPPSLEQSGDTQNECAGAYRGYILRGAPPGGERTLWFRDRRSPRPPRNCPRGRRSGRAADSSQKCASAPDRDRNRWAPAPPILRQCGSPIAAGAPAPAAVR